MDFDTLIERRGTHSAKWDMMEKLYGVSNEDGLAMWVADMDFAPPVCVQDAVKNIHENCIYGYFGGDGDYKAAIQWWMKTRHGWDVDSSWILDAHGLVNGTAMCVDALTDPGDGIVLFTPVYHAFAKVIKAAGRQVVECRLVNENGRYEMDFDRYDAQMTGTEKMLILCSPHNPGGRVWSISELEAVAAFAKRHDLYIVSDEIHHDLVFPGHTHTPMIKIEGIKDRLVMMTAATKTFNIAGSHLGNIIVENEELRARIDGRNMALGLKPNSFGLFMTTAAYSTQGAEWVDALVSYLDENRKVFDAGVNSIPGLASMRLESTYLSWVDFSGTGMSPAEVNQRIQNTAKIAANLGPTFGAGGESYLRFNIAAPRSIILSAVERIQNAFSDLQ